MIVISIILISYCILLLTLQVGWHRAIRRQHQEKSAFYPFISVIVPVRNERDRVANILRALSKQQYNNFEVILVNDHSNDDTMDVAIQNSFANLSIVDNKGIGKKVAINTGVEVAKGELVVTTDADCIMGEHWLETIRITFAHEKVMLAFGAVAIQGEQSFFHRLQSEEFASLIGSGAATSALGFPTMCNGANLAYRKEAYEKVNGYDGNTHIASGDDEFLMRKILNKYPGGVRFIPYKDGSVTTLPQRSLADFLNQRLRWAAKWKHNSSFYTVALALYIFAVQASILTGLVMLCFSFSYPIALLLLIKLVFEASFIVRVCRFSNAGFSWLAFFFLQLFYPVYVLVIGVLSNFANPLWKGRPIAASA